MRWALWAAAAALAVLLAGWLAGLQPAWPQSLASRGLRPGLAPTRLQPVSVAPKGPDGAGSVWTGAPLKSHASQYSPRFCPALAGGGWCCLLCLSTHSPFN